MEAWRRKLYNSGVIIHYGVSKLDGAPGRGSGRYPLGSGKNPKTVFVSGSSKTQDKTSEYYRKELPKDIKGQLNRHIRKGNKIIVGDAPGIDRQVQDYLRDKGYDNVEIYGPGKKVRYTANEKWKTNPIDASEFEEMSPEWLRKKDIAMTNAADEGLAVILDEGAKATRNNVDRLISQNKNVKVYQLNKGGDDEWLKETLTSGSADKDNNIYKTLSKREQQLVTARDKPPENFANKEEYSKYLANSFLLQYKNTPVSSITIWNEGDGDAAIAIMTRNDKRYRGKGYADKVTKEAVKWLETSGIKNAYWDVRKDNEGSIRLAEKNGFELVKEFDADLNDGWLQYRRNFQNKEKTK